MTKQLTLITGLGRNQDLVLELIDFFNDGEKYPYKEEAAAIRASFAGRQLAAVHLVCTRSVTPVLEKLRHSLLDEYPDLAGTLKEIYLDCDDLACAGDDRAMRDRVYKEVQRLAKESDLVIASGGRKNVTQRLIEAGLLFGCLGYLTITAEDREERANTLGFNVLWTPLRNFALERRPGLVKEELGDNFRSLYLLPLTAIERLRHEKIGTEPARNKEELAWLRRLPKADLHCHLGGAFAPALLKELAAILLDDLEIPATRRQFLRGELEKRFARPLADLAPEHLLGLAGPGATHCLAGLKTLFDGFSEPPHLLTAVLVDSLSVEQIRGLSWHEPATVGERLGWYMACGDLGGSNLLQSKGTLRRALQWLLAESVDENLCFLEVRFSPDNYTRAGMTIPEVIETLLDEARCFMAEHDGFQVNLLIMATRHKAKAAMAAHVAAAVTFGRPGEGKGPRISGFDLAGQEEGNDPMLFQEIFMPLHHHFMNITIHAGEMAEEDKIWQALYLLHAKRIGHGLKLIQNERMMGYVRDYGISIEMCPSSNIQTNGFRYAGDTDNREHLYPLKQYLDFGLAVTVNTDNRGISRTTLSNEYLEAARLSPGGLSRWEILRLIKNSFKAAFLPKDEKDRLLKRVDSDIFSLILDDFFPENH